MTVLSALRRGAGFTPCGSGTASLGLECRVFGHRTGFVECSAQDHFDLAVEAAELVVGPRTGLPLVSVGTLVTVEDVRSLEDHQ